MTTLLELFTKVKDENLSKYALEDLHKEMSQLKVEMVMELAEVEKKRAIFMLQDIEKPTATKNREWKGTEAGLREIDLKAQIKAVGTHLKSLQNRLYIQY